ncbi:Cytosine deaminase related metal-dependent hydrolase [Methanonatronarchaeum thermophilum]|uniref:Cytosine deaminase related metal-dependent hydrolase n=1 Tax=Methanonatronarchaeum thermophilum TaxID=1927129 RepID=A0A1Y3GA35_9EURY|nr:amidohydrolase family protein [Methanonatronarchaeum thermophilum]OUJ18127.1 Cytosine deaminase related metal-dependent hydrolase [Methanonatronarchaeum thermophilum]
MQVIAGTVYKGDYEPIEGYVAFDNGVIMEVGVGEPPKKPTMVGTVVPSFINVHTHLGDASLKVNPDRYSLDELVGPGGIKEKGLENLGFNQLVKGMERALNQACREGTTHHLDFREGGVRGIKALRKAGKNTKINSLIYGRPTKIDRKNIEKVVKKADGVGLSSVCDYSEAELRTFLKTLLGFKIPIGIHAGESKTNQTQSLDRFGRSEVVRSLDFDPNHLVHLTNPVHDDLQKVGESNTPVVVCPRSNKITKSGKPPIKQLLKQNILVGLGTDNAMLCSPSLLDEARHLYREYKLDPETIMKIATINGGKIIGVDNRIIQGNRTNIMVVEEVNMGIKALLKGRASIATVISGLDVIENV